MSPRSPASPGERLMAAYLRQRRLPYEHERRIGSRYPDFSVDHPALGTLVFEVCEPWFRLPGRVGAFDDTASLRVAFQKRKPAQAAAALQQGLPFVLVLRHTRMDVPIDEHRMLGAMFGRPGFRIAIGEEEAREPEPTLRFDEADSILRPNALLGVSAVAILRKFNPTKTRFDAAAKAIGARSQRRDYRRRGEVAAYMRAVADLEERMTAAGTYIPEARLARLIILHNPFATIPLPAPFGGVHDAQWAAIGDGPTQDYALSAEGCLIRNVPGHYSLP